MHDQAWIDEKRRKRMEMVDQFDPEVRTLIHEYGLTVVQALWDCGVRKPRHMRHIVERVLDEFSPTRGTFSGQGVRNALIDANRPLFLNKNKRKA